MSRSRIAHLTSRWNTKGRHERAWTEWTAVETQKRELFSIFMTPLAFAATASPSLAPPPPPPDPPHPISGTLGMQCLYPNKKKVCVGVLCLPCGPIELPVLAYSSSLDVGPKTVLFPLVACRPVDSSWRSRFQTLNPFPPPIQALSTEE